MKKNRLGLIIASVLLLCAMAVNLTGCGTVTHAKDLMEGITPRQVAVLDDLMDKNAVATDFAVRLFKTSAEDDKNTLISPLSVMYALAMTANGAEEQTLAQMEAVLGMSIEELNIYLYSYMQDLSQGEKYKLSLANSIWFTEDELFTPNQEFLQINADYYGADIYKAPFDSKTCRDINNWVKDNTDGMIPKILDRISGDAVMYLINAVAFDAEWKDTYEKSQVKNGEFTKEDGSKETVEFMYGTESCYFEDEYATGFMKYYLGYKYAFVAMLPKEGVSVSEYIASLDGQALSDMLLSPKYATVETAIPKFETEYDVDMSGILREMGMTDAFDVYAANFNSIGAYTENNIYIGRVLHKTYISVNEKGTRAGAATIVEMDCGSTMPPEDIKEVYLDRPFVYMLIDCENNVPFFIGTMMDVNK